MFKITSYCVDGRHQFAKLSVETVINKTGQKFFFGNFVQCKRKNPYLVEIKQYKLDD